MIGKVLAHYEVKEKIGQGGMGEVYLALDTKLGRDVAIKVLPAEFAQDADRLARFRREAKLLASLNHPHIATLHGMEEVDGHVFLVMELVPGEDLAARIAKGKIPLQETLHMAGEVAEALEAAHEQGVIHRDLKPANVKATPDMTVKVLDFGLAKAMESEQPDGDASLTQSPTVSPTMGTLASVILGTAAYMSPEQARGKPLDKRTDIFAFGCLMYEMLTGKKAFEGETISDTLASVLKVDPDYDALPSDLPSPISRLLKRCLEKNPKQRLRDIGEARIAIEAFQKGDHDEVVTAAAAPSRGRSRTPLWIGAILLAAVVAAGAVWSLRPQPEARVIQATLLTPGGTMHSSWGGGHLALSPDGKKVVFAVRDSTGDFSLWIRHLASPESNRLTEADALYPFWSPDSRFVAFFGEGKLQKLDVSGGVPITICDAQSGRGGTWNQDGTILFSANWNSPILEVSSSGGVPRAVTSVDSTLTEVSHRWPHFLPNGKQFFYSVIADTDRVYLGSLESGERREILLASSNVILRGGHLLFLREGTLFAQQFDEGAMSLSGDPFVVDSDIPHDQGFKRGAFTASRTGALVTLKGITGVEEQLTIYDRDGRVLENIPTQGGVDDLDLTRDNSRLVMAMDGGTGSDVWIYNLNRSMFSRVSFTESSDDPVWSPDGQAVVYSSAGDLTRRPASGAGSPEVVLGGNDDNVTQDWSGDGRYIAFGRQPEGRGEDIWFFSFEDSSHFPMREAPFRDICAEFSPDSRWISYASDESGRFEVYVQDFPGLTGKWQVSTQGGFDPRWRADGKELFFLGLDRAVHAAGLDDSGASVQVGEAEQLFPVPSAGVGARTHQYAVTSDGQQFIIREPRHTPESMGRATLILNWLEMARR